MKIKRCAGILAAVLCFSVLVTACGEDADSGALGGAKQTGSSQQGKFMQQEVTPQQMSDVVIEQLRQLPDGRIVALGAAEGSAPKAYATADGAAWEEAFVFGETDLFSTYSDYRSRYTVDNEGTWWMVFYMLEGGKSHLFRIKDGEVKEVPVSLFQSGSVSMVTDLRVDSNNTLAINCPSENGGKTIFIDCNSVAEASVVNQAGFEFSHGKLYNYGLNEATIITYGTDGKQLAKDTMPLEVGALYASVGSISSDGVLHYTDGKGIHKVALGGTYIETIADSFSHAYADDSFARLQFLTAQDGSFWLLGRASMKDCKIYRYVFDPNASAVAASTLTVWAMDDDPLLKLAASEFSNANPDCDLILEIGHSGETSAQTDEDIIRTLNTRLLTGEAPDVLILDGLPIYSMIKQDMLTDLSGLVDESQYFENILSGYSKGGKTYAYPTMFWAPVMAQKPGSSPDISGINTLEDLGTLAQKDKVEYGGYYHMFDTLYIAASAQIFPEDSSVNKDALRSFLSLTKGIVDAQGLAGTEYDKEFGVDHEYHQSATSSTLFGGSNPSFGYFINEYKGNSSHAAITLSGYDSQLLTSTVEKLAPLPGNAFLPIGIVGVPTGAENEEQGREFVKTMLECQTKEKSGMVGFTGMLVRRDVDKYFMQTMPDDYKKTLGIDTNRTDLDDMIDKLSVASSTDFSLRQKVYTQARLMYTGSLTMDEAMNEILKNTELYFAEKK